MLTFYLCSRRVFAAFTVFFVFFGCFWPTFVFVTLRFFTPCTPLSLLCAFKLFFRSLSLLELGGGDVAFYIINKRLRESVTKCSEVRILSSSK